MQTTYHLKSAQDINSDLLDAIKTKFKSKPITIIVEDADDYELTEELKDVLKDRLQEDKTNYLTAKESIDQLNKKYGL